MPGASATDARTYSGGAPDGAWVRLHGLQGRGLEGEISFNG